MRVRTVGISPKAACKAKYIFFNFYINEDRFKPAIYTAILSIEALILVSESTCSNGGGALKPLAVRVEIVLTTPLLSVNSS